MCDDRIAMRRERRRCRLGGREGLNLKDSVTMSVFCSIDDKHVPLYRILWVSDLPHYCGSSECEREGEYEVRLDGGESLWGDRDDRDAVLAAVEAWQKGMST